MQYQINKVGVIFFDSNISLNDFLTQFNHLSDRVNLTQLFHTIFPDRKENPIEVSTPQPTAVDTPIVETKKVKQNKKRK